MSDDTLTAVPDRLREAREHSRLSVDQVSRRLNYSPLLIEGMEDGTINPTDGALFQLARLYRCSVEQLCGETARAAVAAGEEN